MSRALAWRAAPVAAAAVMVAVYFLLDPRISDLPAAEFRTWLFETEGFTVWNGQWYAGHHTPGYSIVFPPLAALFGGPEVVGAIATLASAFVFERIVHHHYGPAARWGALLFGLGAGTLLFSSRLPWSLGAAFALAAVLALQRRRPYAAAGLAVLSTLSSPVAGAFLALGATAYFLADRRRSRLKDAALLAAGGLVPPLLLTTAFPEGGYHPFVFSSFFIVPLVALAALPFFTRAERTLRIACVLYAIAAVGLFVVPTPFGGNTVRLGQLVGAPIVLCALVATPPRAARWRVAAGALMAVLVWWQWAPIVREYLKVDDDPSVEASYYAPLLRFLGDQRGPPARVTIPQMRSQWESYYVAKEHPSGRGWLRQVDVELNPLFYDDGALDPERYRRWLGENAVRWVAIPDAPIGYGGKDEVDLIRKRRPAYLREVHRSDDWTVYEYTEPHPLVVPDGGADIAATSLNTDEVELDVRRPGSALVRVHFSPYWRLTGGCVERAGDWTRITPERAGRARLVTTWAPGRVVSRGRRCA